MKSTKVASYIMFNILKSFAVEICGEIKINKGKQQNCVQYFEFIKIEICEGN